MSYSKQYTVDDLNVRLLYPMTNCFYVWMEFRYLVGSYLHIIPEENLTNCHEKPTQNTQFEMCIMCIM